MTDNRKTKPFTFPSTGLTCQIARVAPYVTFAVRQAMESKRPQPPMQEVEYPDGTRLEPNLGHPDHARNMRDFDIAVGDACVRAMIVAGLVEFDREAVQTMRQKLTALGADLQHEDDALVYVLYWAAADSEDVIALVRAIQGESNATEEAIKIAGDTF
jgi:hypothetical protein